MKRKKLPYFIRLIRYWFKCLWYYVLFPLGAEEDEFTNQLKNKKLTKNSIATQSNY